MLPCMKLLILKYEQNEMLLLYLQLKHHGSAVRE